MHSAKLVWITPEPEKELLIVLVCRHLIKRTQTMKNY